MVVVWYPLLMEMAAELLVVVEEVVMRARAMVAAEMVGTGAAVMVAVWVAARRVVRRAEGVMAVVEMAAVTVGMIAPRV